MIIRKLAWLSPSTHNSGSNIPQSEALPVFDPQQPDKYYSIQVNYYAPLDDSGNDTVDTVPTTGSESDTDCLSDEETIVASNCLRQCSATGGEVKVYS